MLISTTNSWQIRLRKHSIKLTGGPLEHRTYVTEQFHAHWGDTTVCGSEHTISAETFSGELHIVFWNVAYKNFTKAMRHVDGLAVLAVFLKTGKVHSEFQKIAPYLTTNCEALIHVNLKKLLPKRRSFWSYHGSLTTPPYNESVTWIVFKEPIEMSFKQLQIFRKLKVEQNFRKPLPLAGREIVEYDDDAVT